MKFSLVLTTAAATSSAVAKSSTTYEVWGCDQSNTVAGLDTLGAKGSYLWIWDNADVDDVINTGVTPKSKGCTPNSTEGPCDLLEMFPGTLVDFNSNTTLSDSEGFGRWHGITTDPQNRYVTANIFAPNGGYVGIVDTDTKGAIALFRVTLMTYDAGADDGSTKSTRNVHMSFWNSDGSAIIIHNLAGKAVERINVERNDDGKITSLTFDKSATTGVGKGMSVVEEATYYVGENAFGEKLLGAVTGSYDEADIGDVILGTEDLKEGSDVGRPNNVPICPVIAKNGLVFNTFGGGGLFVMDSTKTPMDIVASYPNSVIYGAGVCGEAVGDKVYVTSGNSASGAGVTQSMWALFAFDSTQFDGTITPDPTYSFDFPGTATGGRKEGAISDDTGQIVGITTRRDAHDLAGTIDGKYVHVIDRIQDVIDVFDTITDVHVGTYSLRTASGNIDDIDTNTGTCYEASVMDGGDNFTINNPGADFIAPSPDGKYMMLSLRGPAPVSATHSAQGSCPGVGIVELKDGGASGSLVGVLRTVNEIEDTVGVVSPSGGIPYVGKERSDVHDVVVIKKAGSIDIDTGIIVETSSSAASYGMVGVGALIGVMAWLVC